MKAATYMMKLMTVEAANIITRWKYEPPYSFYNMVNDSEGVQELLDGSYFIVINRKEELVGYFCYGKNAQVSGGHKLGLYIGKDILDIGLGLRPDLTGKGMGLHFLNIGLDFARLNYPSSAIRLSVATFNRRAVTLYDKAGFKKVETFMSKVRGDEVEFMLMEKILINSPDSVNEPCAQK